MKFYLQLFAKASSSGSTTTSSQHEEGGSSSSTVGGSHSVTTGESHSYSTGHSTTEQKSQGGSHSESGGKSWASGKVEETTQANRDQYNKGYEEGQKVADTYNRLQETLTQKPGFQSKYESKLDELYNQIMNRDKFSYNFNADPMYQMYKDQYTQSGKRAMEDTMAQAQIANGGYGSSYAQSVGQQTYQNYLQDLNKMLPQLRNQAYQEYQDEANRQLQQYNLTSDAYNREYGQYRDFVSDWQSDRSFNQSAYQDERNFDYNQFNNERNYWNQEYWNEKNAEQSNSQAADATNWQNSFSETNSQSQTDTYSKQVTDSSFWQNTNTSNWSDSSSVVNNMAWTNPSIGTGTGSGGGSTGSVNQRTIDNYNVGNSGWYDSIDARKAQSIRPDSYLGNITNNSTNSEKWNDNLPKNTSIKSEEQFNRLIQDLSSARGEQQQAQVIYNMQNNLGLTDKEIEALIQKANMYYSAAKY